MLDTDEDSIVTRADLLRALGGACTEEEIDEMFKQMGCGNGKLFFMDLMRLMTDTSGQAGVRLRGASQVSFAGGLHTSGGGKSRPSIGAIGRSSTMSNVTLHSEVSSEKKSGKPMDRSLWLSKGRSVQNLSKAIKAMNETVRESRRGDEGEGDGDGGDEGGAGREPSSPPPNRIYSRDGSVLATAVATTDRM